MVDEVTKGGVSYFGVIVPRILCKAVNAVLDVERLNPFR